MGNYTKNEIIQLFPYLILYSKNRQIYFKYIKENIITYSTFINRRYSIIFLNKCLQIYSYRILNKIVNDQNNVISACIINVIYIYNRKIILGTNFIFQNICKNLYQKNRYIKDIIHLNLTNNNDINIKYNNNKI